MIKNQDQGSEASSKILELLAVIFWVYKYLNTLVTNKFRKEIQFYICFIYKRK